MAQPIQPFSGGGGYGNIMSPYYQEISQQVGDNYIARQNAKSDLAQQALNSIIGIGARFGGAESDLIQKAIPSSLNEYYAQSSELDKKSNAMKKMLEINPELFGLNQDQAKQLGDVTSKMSSTERHAFFQDYVPTLFKAQQAKAEQTAISSRALIGKEIPPNISDLGQGLKSAISGQQTSSTSQNSAPSSMPGSEIDLQSGADKLQSHMESKYGADWKSRGLKVSRQDVIDAGL